MQNKSSSHTQTYLKLIGVVDLPPLTSPFDPGYDPATLESHLEQSSHLISILKISMACWLVANETATRRKVSAAVKTEGFRGKIEKSVTVTSNDPAHSTAQLRVRAEVVGSVEFVPRPGLAFPEGMEWTATAAHSHNGYLDTALGIGLPGLALLIVVLVIAPLRNFHAADRSGNDGHLTTLLLRIWLFGLYLSSLESFFLDRADPLWFTFLMAVFGLHYLARYRLKA